MLFALRPELQKLPTEFSANELFGARTHDPPRSMSIGPISSGSPASCPSASHCRSQRPNRRTADTRPVGQRGQTYKAEKLTGNRSEVTFRAEHRASCTRSSGRARTRTPTSPRRASRDRGVWAPSHVSERGACGCQVSIRERGARACVRDGRTSDTCLQKRVLKCCWFWCEDGHKAKYAFQNSQLPLYH